MKKTLLFPLLILSLFLSACAPKGSPLAFFEKDFRLLAAFSLPKLSLTGECSIRQNGDGSIRLLSPESLCGVTLYKRGNEVSFTLGGVSLTVEDTRLFDFFALQNATITARKEDRETVFLVGNGEKGSFEITLRTDGVPRHIVTAAGELTVQEILP